MFIAYLAFLTQMEGIEYSTEHTQSLTTVCKACMALAELLAS